MTHVISLLVENHQGVLSRISGLFSGRGYNLESLTVGPTSDPTTSRITLVCKGEDAVIVQIKKQLNKLIDIIKVIDLSETLAVHRELALVKVKADPDKRGEILGILDIFKAKVLDVSPSSLLMEITGAPDKIDNCISVLSDYGILEMARSGLVSLERGKKAK